MSKEFEFNISEETLEKILSLKNHMGFSGKSWDEWFNKILDQAKEIESKIKESQEKIKKIEAEGISGLNSVKVTLNGEGDITKIELSQEVLKEEKTIIEDLIMAAHNNAKSKLKTKTTEEISKATNNFGIPGFKWPT